MRRATILVAILAFVPVVGATAQLRPGERVRVTGHFCQFYSNCAGGYPQHRVGSFVAWESDTLVVQSNGDTLAVPQDFVTKLEVSTGRGYSKAHAIAGMIGGMFVGSLIGIAIADVTAEEGCSSLDVTAKRDKGNCLANGFLVGFLGGSLVGWGIGALIPGDRWADVPLDRLRVSVAPQRDGRFGLGLSVRF